MNVIDKQMENKGFSFGVGTCYMERVMYVLGKRRLKIFASKSGPYLLHIMCDIHALKTSVPTPLLLPTDSQVMDRSRYRCVPNPVVE